MTSWQVNHTCLHCLVELSCKNPEVSHPPYSPSHLGIPRRIIPKSLTALVAGSFQAKNIRSLVPSLQTSPFWLTALLTNLLHWVCYLSYPLLSYALLSYANTSSGLSLLFVIMHLPLCPPSILPGVEVPSLSQGGWLVIINLLPSKYNAMLTCISLAM